MENPWILLCFQKNIIHECRSVLLTAAFKLFQCHSVQTWQTQKSFYNIYLSTISFSIFISFHISNHQISQLSQWRTAPPKGLVLGAAAAAAAPKGLDAAGGPPIGGGPIGGGPAGGPELSPFSTGSLGGWFSCTPEEMLLLFHIDFY